MTNTYVDEDNRTTIGDILMLIIVYLVLRFLDLIGWDKWGEPRRGREGSDTVIESRSYHREHGVVAPPRQPPSKVATAVMTILLLIVMISSIGLVVVGTNPDFARWVINNEIYQAIAAWYQSWWH